MNTDQQQNRKTGKRLVKYALWYKKTIILALFMLTIAVAAELTGPFIAKKIIDTHILGIEYSWYESASGTDAVLYQGNWYKRSDRFEENEEHGQEVRILQVDRSYYFINEEISFDGERVVEGDQLTITRGEQQAVYQVQALSSGELFAFFEPEIKRILYLMGLYFLLLVFASFFQYEKGYLLQESANQVIQRMRRDVFAHIQRLPIQYFDNMPAGKIVARTTNDTEAIRELYVTVLATFFTSAIYFLGIFTALFILDVRLALICLTLLPMLGIWVIVYRKYASKYNHVIRMRISDLNGFINEAIQGMTIIQAFRRQKEEKRDFEAINEEHFLYQNKLLSLNALTSHNLANVLRNLFLVALIWYFGGASLGVGTLISVGVIYAFVDYLNRLFEPITDIVTKLAQLEEALVAGNRVFELVDEEGIDVTLGAIDRFRGDVRFEDVSFGYTPGEHVLRNISFEAKQGQTVALVGHTGSGKSSIMNLLFRFYDIEKGRITIDGQNVQDIPKQLLRQHMGIVLQDPFLFTGTIATNVSLDDPSITREQVEKALHDVGASKRIELFPKGLDEPVLEKGSTLSAGERQLISFARALVFNPAILILDEATANIDTETETLIQKALDVLKQGRTTFIIAHRLSTIKNADQILVLDRGEIVERGDHEELMHKKERYHQMYQLQQGKKKQAVG